MTQLLMIERAILESCGKYQKTIFEISDETGIDISVIGSLCVRLKKKGILKRKENVYFINKEAKSLLIANSNENIRKEIREITNSMIENYFTRKDNRALKLQKVYVNKTEELILNSMLDQLNRFVQDLQKGHRKNTSNVIKKQKVILWGHGNYNDLIDSSLQLAK